MPLVHSKEDAVRPQLLRQARVAFQANAPLTRRRNETGDLPLKFSCVANDWSYYLTTHAGGLGGTAARTAHLQLHICPAGRLRSAEISGRLKKHLPENTAT
jgi:hypothetical protein